MTAGLWEDEPTRFDRANPERVEAFKRFYYDNPHIYDALVRLARQAKEAGYVKIGMKMLFEILRWEYTVVTRDASGFKLTNSWTSPYARIIMYREEDLAGFFRTRGGDWVPEVGDPHRPPRVRRHIYRVPSAPRRREVSEEFRHQQPVLLGAVPTPRKTPQARPSTIPSRTDERKFGVKNTRRAQSKSPAIQRRDEGRAQRAADRAAARRAKSEQESG